jgi:succinoglycan biosynthesis transport protein ExoP
MGYVFNALNRAEGRDAEHGADDARTGVPPMEAAAPPSLSLRGASHDAEPDGPSDYADVDDRIVGLTNPTCSAAEEYRAIRTGLLAKWQHRRHIIHTITSATPQEGKTITSLNLGLIFAELHNRKTIVIEGDLRLPQFDKLLNLPRTAGMVGVLTEKANLAANIHRVGDHQLDVLCAGRPVQDQAVQVLSSNTAVALLKHLKREYDHVIVDTPPVVELADAGILGAISDEVLMVVRMERTPRPLVEQAISTLAGYNAPVASLIATDQTHHRNRYHYYYRYGNRTYNRQYAKAA